MADVPKKYADRVHDIKKNIETWHDYFKNNNKRWYEFKKFAFVTSLNDDDIATLQLLKKPQIEFNICEAYISRLRGEFSKQEPSILVSAASDQPVNPQVLNIYEGHIRHNEYESRKNGTAYDVYSDLLSGGYSVVKVYNDYKNNNSFNQEIVIERVFDPTLTGFDPLARESHKGDGRYCFELFPKTEEEFKQEYPNIDLRALKFEKKLGGFSWAYKTAKEKILLLADYYEKESKKVKIVKLTNGQVMTNDDYKKLVDSWEDFTQPPQVITSRMTESDEIRRYLVIGNQVIKTEKTNYTYLPLVFFDGNSVGIRNSDGGQFEQITRPYIYNLKGIQKLRNFAGQTQANYLENMIQHKWKAPIDGIPKGYEEAYTNPQQADVILYKSHKDDNPDMPLPPPQEVVPVPMPPEVSGTFSMTDNMAQSTLGSYDAALGINDNELSGIAIVEAATQSNATAMPYIVSYMNGLNRVAEIELDLISKFMINPMVIPVRDQKGNSTNVPVNVSQSQSLKINPESLNVKVEAGVNFEIEKNRTVKTMIAMMQASPAFAAFMNSEGLENLLDNLNIRGIDELKEKAAMFAQQQKIAAEQAGNQNPLLLRAQTEQQKVALQAQQAQADNAIKSAQVAVDKQSVDNDRLKILLEAHNDGLQTEIEADKTNAEKARTAVDLMMKQDK